MSQPDSATRPFGPACPNCGSENLYTSPTQANSAYGLSVLPGLARLFRPAMLDVVVCADCGLTRLFAREAERMNLQRGLTWRRL